MLCYKIATLKGKRIVSGEPITTYFAIHQETGITGYYITHVLSGYALVGCRLSTVEDARKFASAIEKLLGEELLFRSANKFIKIIQKDPHRKNVRKLLSVLGKEEIVNIKDIRRIAMWVKNGTA